MIIQKIHYLLVKMTNQIVSYFANKKKSTLITMASPNWLIHIDKAIFFDTSHLGIFRLKNPVKKPSIVIVMGLS
jgi:hypothetical protein